MAVPAGTSVIRYVTQTVDGCQSPATMVTATAKTVPGAPSAQDNGRCDGGIVALSATGTDLKWYSDANLQTMVGSGSPLNVNVPAGSSVVRYVTQTVNGCESGPATVTASATTVPGAPSAQNADRCDTGNVALTASGANLKWYSDANLQIQVGTGSPLNVNVTAGSSVIRYVTQTVNGCESAPVSTCGAFGNTHHQIVDESVQAPGVADGEFTSYYEQTKVEAHRLADRMIEEGLPGVIVQPGGVYGPGDSSQLFDLLDQFLKGKMPLIPFPELGLCLAHVEDTAAGIVLALDKGGTGETYVIAGPPTTMRDAVASSPR